MEQDFKVGQLTVRKKWIEGRYYLQFEAAPHPKTATVVIMAMFAIAKYLKWWNNETINDHAIQIVSSSSGRNIYMDGWESMRLTADGRVLWAQISKYHLQILMSKVTRDELPKMFQQENMKVLELVSVEKLYLEAELSSEKKEQVKRSFVEFVNDNCKNPGTYELDFDQFCQDIKLPVPAVWRTLSPSFQELFIDGMLIYSVYCDGKTMQITVV